jgi:multiple sugar transport system ATP-binding protein
MNFFQGTVFEKGGRLWFTENSRDGDAPLLLQAHEDHDPKLAAWVGKKVALGIRPEDLEDRAVASNPNANPAHIFSAALEVTEPLGAETYFYLTTKTHSFIARSQGQVRERVGCKIELVANMKKAHFFEVADPSGYKKETGEIDLEKWQTACPLIV